MRETDPHRPTRGLIPAALALLALLTPALAQPTEADLAETVEAIVTKNLALATASVGVHIRELDTGRSVYTHNADEPLIPASNLKLFTTGAALITLGQDHAFTTSFELDGRTLIIKGTGDPGLGDPALLEEAEPPLTIDDLLTQIVNALTTAGVVAIDEIVADDRVFDREYAHPTWPEDQLNRWYCAEVAGINLHTNCITFFVRPSPTGPGSAPIVDLAPAAPWIEWSNRGRTVSSGRTTSWVARPTPANRFTLFGDVHQRSSAAVDVAIHEPPLFAAQVLADRLARAGVAIAGTTDPSRTIRHARLVNATETFDNARPLVVVRTAMADALRRANVNSQNLYTEALIKASGHAVTGEPGSWATGASVVRMLVAERLGPEHARSLRVADGSGMSRDNRVAAHTVTAWLRSLLKDEETARPYLDSLPTPGEGTLRSRFRDQDLAAIVRAKSGSINGVRCLSGIVASPRTGRTYAFSVLVNDATNTQAIRAAKDLHEDIVAAIDDYLLESDTIRANAPTEDSPAYGG